MAASERGRRYSGREYSCFLGYPDGGNPTLLVFTELMVCRSYPGAVDFVKIDLLESCLNDHAVIAAGSLQ